VTFEPLKNLFYRIDEFSRYIKGMKEDGRKEAVLLFNEVYGFITSIKATLIEKYQGEIDILSADEKRLYDIYSKIPEMTIKVNKDFISRAVQGILGEPIQAAVERKAAEIVSQAASQEALTQAAVARKAAEIVRQAASQAASQAALTQAASQAAVTQAASQAAVTKEQGIAYGVVNQTLTNTIIGGLLENICKRVEEQETASQATIYTGKRRAAAATTTTTENQGRLSTVVGSPQEDKPIEKRNKATTTTTLDDE
jgi:hypothetical protein